MGSTTVVDEICQKYINRNINSPGWVASRNSKTDEERSIYLVPLQGSEYDTNNRAVWHKIQKFFIRNTAYDWIKEFEAKKYGRAAWLALL